MSFELTYNISADNVVTNLDWTLVKKVILCSIYNPDLKIELTEFITVGKYFIIPIREIEDKYHSKFSNKVSNIKDFFDSPELIDDYYEYVVENISVYGNTFFIRIYTEQITETVSNI